MCTVVSCPPVRSSHTEHPQARLLLQGRFCVVPMLPAFYAQHLQIFNGLAAAPLQVMWMTCPCRPLPGCSMSDLG